MMIREHAELAPLCSIGLGGQARYLTECKSKNDIIEAVRWADEKKLPVQILGGGSNTIFSDNGFSGLVLLIKTENITETKAKEKILIEVDAGVPWDQFVSYTVDRGLAGIETLSGIPGSTGAAPVQNIGAYGQEAGSMITNIRGFNVRDLSEAIIAASECNFAYRDSVFKRELKNKFIITSVTFAFEENKTPVIRYPELSESIRNSDGGGTLQQGGSEALNFVRNHVLRLRAKKSMVIDPADPHSRSVGSFFLNPIVTLDQYEAMNQEYSKNNKDDRIPFFESENGRKIPAAWLIEHSGFSKGYRHGGAGISLHHSLALVNYKSSTSELLEFARMIADGVKNHFGVALEREPVIVP